MTSADRRRLAEQAIQFAELNTRLLIGSGLPDVMNSDHQNEKWLAGFKLYSCQNTRQTREQPKDPHHSDASRKSSAKSRDIGRPSPLQKCREGGKACDEQQLAHFNPQIERQQTQAQL
jgi:hypothetical protein